MKKNIFAICILLGTFCFCGFDVAAQNRRAVSAAEVNGTFRAKGGSEFKILALGSNKLKIEFSGVYEYRMANGEMMANIGEASGEAEINGDTAVFTNDYVGQENKLCKITIKFVRKGLIRVTQDSFECGFGHNVSADGDYRKISSKKPTFDEER